MQRIGRVKEIVRYPIKSMAGISTPAAFLGWHGVTGDRRFAFRRIGDNNGFPWLTASRLPEMVLYTPTGVDERADEPTPTHVRTPEGESFEIEGDALLRNVAERCGHPLELMRFKHGIFDDAAVSIIDEATMAAICHEGGQPTDARRFRPNIVIEGDGSEAFCEDHWLGRQLQFGDNSDGPVVGATMHDVRCMMINLHPATAKQNPEIMKAVVRMNGNKAGAYGTVVRAGNLQVGQPIYLD